MPSVFNTSSTINHTRCPRRAEINSENAFQNSVHSTIRLKAAGLPIKALKFVGSNAIPPHYISQFPVRH